MATKNNTQTNQICLFLDYVDTQSNFVNVERPLLSKKIFTVISLFSGCGGKDLGVIGNFNIFGRHYDKNNFDIIWSNDCDKHACDTYRHNFKHDIV